MPKKIITIDWTNRAGFENRVKYYLQYLESPMNNRGFSDSHLMLIDIVEKYGREATQAEIEKQLIELGY